MIKKTLALCLGMSFLILGACLSIGFSEIMHVPAMDGTATIKQYRSREMAVFVTETPTAYSGWILLSRQYGEWSDWNSWGSEVISSSDKTEVETREGISGEKEYRSRTRSCQYTYGRWENWSAWSDEYVEENENRQVESRTISVISVPDTAVNIQNVGQIQMLAKTGTQLVLPGIAGPIIWKSENPSVASVDAKGYVSAHGAGITDVYACSFKNLILAGTTLYVTDSASSLPADTAAIDDEAFSGTGLEAVDLRKTRTESIGVSAFSNSEKLKLVLTDGMTGSIESNAFDGSPHVTVASAGKDSVYQFAESRGMARYIWGEQKAYVPVSRIDLNRTDFTMEIGECVQLHASISPMNATNPHVSWYTQDDAVQVDELGFITALHSGTATVFAISEDGRAKVQCCITVTGIPVTSVMIDQPSLSLTEGETAHLSATILPDNATDPSIVWSSKDPNVASVIDGTVTANTRGSTLIYAKAYDGSGIIASCTVTVGEKVTRDDSLFFSIGADSITDNDARIFTTINVLSNPDIIGFYIGTDAENLEMAAVQDTKKHGSELLTNISYQMSEWNRTLSPDTEYYYRFYLMNDDNIIVSSIQSFRTAEAVEGFSADEQIPKGTWGTCETEIVEGDLYIQHYLDEYTNNYVRVFVTINEPANFSIETVGCKFHHDNDIQEYSETKVEDPEFAGFFFDPDLDAYQFMFSFDLDETGSDLFSYYIYIEYYSHYEKISYQTKVYSFLRPQAIIEPDIPEDIQQIRLVAIGNAGYNKEKSIEDYILWDLLFGISENVLLSKDAFGNVTCMKSNANNLVSAYSSMSSVGSKFANAYIDPLPMSDMKSFILSGFAGADSNDISILYFGGHGAFDGNTYASVLTDWSYFLASDYASIADVIDGTKVFIIDTCHSGEMAHYFRGRSDVFVLGASLRPEDNVDSRVRNRPDGRDTYMMHYFFEGIGWKSGSMPADYDGNGIITFSEIVNYVVPKVRDDTSHIGVIEERFHINLQIPQVYMPSGKDCIIYQRDSI